MPSTAPVVGRIQAKLRELEWFVEWNVDYTQSFAWMIIEEHWAGPYEGEEVDPDKVLFNISQDCEVDEPWPECEACEGTRLQGDDTCPQCEGQGKLIPPDVDRFDCSFRESGFICYHPEQVNSSYFAFGDAKAVRSVLPLIRACGCKVVWDGDPETRLLISWDID